jgi:hypothetical protein
MEKITDSGVVTIAIDHFVFEMGFVVPQLVFNIGELGIELVFFVVFGLAKIGV